MDLIFPAIVRLPQMIKIISRNSIASVSLAGHYFNFLMSSTYLLLHWNFRFEHPPYRFIAIPIDFVIFYYLAYINQHPILWKLTILFIFFLYFERLRNLMDTDLFIILLGSWDLLEIPTPFLQIRTLLKTQKIESLSILTVIFETWFSIITVQRITMSQNFIRFIIKLIKAIGNFILLIQTICIWIKEKYSDEPPPLQEEEEEKEKIEL